MRRVDGAVAGLPPSAFAFVMASAITALGFDLLDQAFISLTLLVFAVTGGVLLAVATVWRLAAHRSNVMSDAGNPAKTFGFFTTVAAANVVGAYLGMSGRFTGFAALALFSAVLWLLLTYVLPSAVVLGHGDKSVMADVNGSWFLWVVGTQSVATSAAIAAGRWHPEIMGSIAIGLWGVGIALYLLVATLVTLRMLVRENVPTGLSPTYWIYMGATAISVLAGSRILLLPADLPIMQATRHFVAGMSYVLWSLGLWWIPLLLIFGLWRHMVRRVPLKYEAALWSIVFPLGMYSVASMLYGATQDIAFMIRTGQTGIWIAGAIWLVSTVAMLRSGVRWFAPGTTAAGPEKRLV